MSAELLKTPLHAFHVEHGAKMVPFAGYEMPVSYPAGIVAEHKQCRESAALFDVSHMGQIRLIGDGADRALESLMPIDLIGLGLNQQRYGFFTNSAGGILDDLMVTRFPSEGEDGRLLLVVNAAGKDADYVWIAERLPGEVAIEPMPERALLALQGPMAVDALTRHCPQASALGFMTAGPATFDGIACHVSRSGYTGEDGFEIVMPAARAEATWNALAAAGVKPCGLGARDTLRLEAGMNLYGQDMDART
ncbi:MAG: glycine cleavage system aminomethyltransferase GcvT, partial [Rubrivivax sp.]|nr:glycine cleavage system aminomethyltransferase GcvT [Rubrivivax sp.]